MTHFSLAATLTLIGSTASRYTSESKNEVLLRNPPTSQFSKRLYSGQKNAIESHDGMCRLRLQNNGDLKVERKVDGGSWETSWHTGAHEDGSYFAALQSTGKLVVYKEGETPADNVAVYDTNSNDLTGLEGGDVWELVFSNDRERNGCRLMILTDGEMGGVSWWNKPEYPYGGYTWWMNSWPYFDGGFVLQKGEFFKDQCYGEKTAYLQHDCNLVVFEGTDRADKTNSGVIWSTGTPEGDITDCYLYGDLGEVVLYEGQFNKRKAIWSEKRGARLWNTPPSFLEDFDRPDLFEYEVCIDDDGFSWS